MAAGSEGRENQYLEAYRAGQFLGARLLQGRSHEDLEVYTRARSTVDFAGSGGRGGLFKF